MLYGAETGTSSLPKKGSGCLTPGLALSPVPNLGTCSCGRGQVSHPHQRLRAHTSQPREAPVQSQSKSTPANTQGMPLGAFWFLKKCTNPLLGASSFPQHRCPSSPCTALLPAAPRASSAANTSYLIPSAISWLQDVNGFLATGCDFKCCSVSPRSSVWDTSQPAPEPLITDSGLFLALFPYCQESEARRENYSLS